MSIETTLVAYVLGQSAITALIGRRFEPVQNAQGTLLPAVHIPVYDRWGNLVR